eukprot:CAMPEP_0185175730 /NCGR_PEP_ID=MMETSP1139-20130426/27246_1 /TAXON_ID=298111 /ORGANISM="Pavlova sp., Strain CCMP459" /LENGTH=133 /DNA_ID=CAMNT_0027741471 /DNA_START=1 /DNA_END=399 /DNA_ORIENTATION=+
MFLQEVAILQMQADGWKQEWQTAIQDNEHLRSALNEAQGALAAKAGGDKTVNIAAAAQAAQMALSSMGGAMPINLPPADSQTAEQWRELCVQITRTAGDERAALMDEVGRLRQEADEQRERAMEFQRAKEEME